MDKFIKIIEKYVSKKEIKEIIKTIKEAQKQRTNNKILSTQEAVEQAIKKTGLNDFWCPIICYWLLFHWNEVSDWINSREE